MFSVLSCYYSVSRHKNTNYKSFVKLYFQLFFLTMDKWLWVKEKKMPHFLFITIKTIF